MDHKIHRFHWQGIEIEARYVSLKRDLIADLEIESIEPEHAPLPIAETGARSYFYQSGPIETFDGNVVEQVIAWLDAEADRPAWKKYIEASRQGDLFDF